MIAAQGSRSFLTYDLRNVGATTIIESPLALYRNITMSELLRMCPAWNDEIHAATRRAEVKGLALTGISCSAFIDPSASASLHALSQTTLFRTQTFRIDGHSSLNE